MLAVASYILAFHRGRPVRLRLWCALLTPLVMGAILHLFLYKGEFAMGLEGIQGLWTQGLEVKCGGVVSGLIAETLVLVFSRVGGGVILILGQCLMFLGAFHLSVVDIVDAFRNRPRPVYEYEEEEETPEPKPARRKPVPVEERRRAAIDIPVDDGPVPPPERHPERPFTPQKERFFNRKAGVLPPDQVLTGGKPMDAKAPEAAPETQSPASEEAGIEVQPIPVPEPAAAEPPAPVQAEPEVPRCRRSSGNRP